VTPLALAKLQEDAFILTDGEHSDVAREEWKKKISYISVLGHNTLLGTVGLNFYQIT